MTTALVETIVDMPMDFTVIAQSSFKLWSHIGLLIRGIIYITPLTKARDLST